MNTQNQHLTISEVSEATGLSVHTLRYYERIGLIHPIDRAQNTHRRYSQQDIGWINLLIRLRATGMSIEDMVIYAQLQRQGDATLPERIAMLRTLEGEVEAHIDTLHEHLKLIRHKIDVYSTIVAETFEPEAAAEG
jgi:DNA-binding transcriptional MerR regulator